MSGFGRGLTPFIISRDHVEKFILYTQYEKEINHGLSKNKKWDSLFNERIFD